MKLYTKDLYSLQVQLDDRIFQLHHVTREQTTKRRILALLVEVGELANETRCFKFWSQKGASEKAVVLEEYVDGIHFLLSLGIDLHFTPNELTCESVNRYDLLDLFIKIYEKTCLLDKDFTKENYLSLFDIYLMIGNYLEFSPSDIRNAYLAKNEENHHRQDINY